MRLIPHSRPWISEEDRKAVKEVLDSLFLAQGERTQVLEQTLSSWVHAAGGVAVGSGSAALSLALIALGVKAGDEVLLPTYVCPSVMETVTTRGAVAVLTDVGENWVVTPDDVAKRISRRTRAVIVPHMYGFFADMHSFRQFSVPVIEDCAQAVAEDGTRTIGGDIAIFSLHPTKCITSGEGGVAVSKDPDLVRKMRALRDGTTDHSTERLFSPLSDLCSGIGVQQLKRYSEALARRKLLANGYRAALESIIPQSLVPAELAERSMNFRFLLRIGGGLERFEAPFRRKGVAVRRGGVNELLHRFQGISDDLFPVSTELFNRTVSLPIYPALSDAEHTQCVHAAVEIFS